MICFKYYNVIKYIIPVLIWIILPFCGLYGSQEGIDSKLKRQHIIKTIDVADNYLLFNRVSIDPLNEILTDEIYYYSVKHIGETETFTVEEEKRYADEEMTEEDDYWLLILVIGLFAIAGTVTLMGVIFKYARVVDKKESIKKGEKKDSQKMPEDKSEETSGNVDAATEQIEESNEPKSNEFKRDINDEIKLMVELRGKGVNRSLIDKISQLNFSKLTGSNLAKKAKHLGIGKGEIILAKQLEDLKNTNNKESINARGFA